GRSCPPTTWPPEASRGGARQVRDAGGPALRWPRGRRPPTSEDHVADRGHPGRRGRRRVAAHPGQPAGRRGGSVGRLGHPRARVRRAGRPSDAAARAAAARRAPQGAPALPVLAVWHRGADDDRQRRGPRAAAALHGGHGPRLGERLTARRPLAARAGSSGARFPHTLWTSLGTRNIDVTSVTSASPDRARTATLRSRQRYCVAVMMPPQMARRPTPRYALLIPPGSTSR